MKKAIYFSLLSLMNFLYTMQLPNFQALMHAIELADIHAFCSYKKEFLDPSQLSCLQLQMSDKLSKYSQEIANTRLSLDQAHCKLQKIQRGVQYVAGFSLALGIGYITGMTNFSESWLWATVSPKMAGLSVVGMLGSGMTYVAYKSDYKQQRASLEQKLKLLEKQSDNLNSIKNLLGIPSSNAETSIPISNI